VIFLALKKSSLQNKTVAVNSTPAATPIAPNEPAVAPQQQPENNFQPQPQQQGGNDNPPLMLLIGALDANHDRVVNKIEIASASANLKSLDRNNDGKLEPGEYLTATDLASGQYKQFRIYQVLRPDASSVIGSNEIANAPAELMALDANRNGQLDPQEFGPAGSPPPNAGGNPQGGPPNGVRQGGRPPPPR